MSWDTIKGIRQGEKNAKAQERAKKRSARLAGGSGYGKSKSCFSRAAGHRAAARGGRGIVIKSHKSGRGFKGIMEYANDLTKSPQIVFTNCGTNAQDALRTMCRVSSLRPAISKPVAHITMSLPPAIGKDERRWPEFVQELREKLEIDDSFPCISVRHNDTDHDHVHFIFSRVSVAGEVWDEWGNQLKCAAAEEAIEQKFGLKIFPRSGQNQKAKLTKNEVEQGIRTSKLPPRAQIEAALKIAVQGKPTVQQFVERLQSAGVGVRANVATTGRMNGFSFAFGGVEFGASKVSKEFGWKALSERIEYDEIADREFLAVLDGGTGTAGADLARTAATVDALDRAVSSISPATPDAGANLGNSAPVVNRAVSSNPARRTETPARAAAPAATTIAGFSRSEILDSGMRGWISSLHNRIELARVPTGAKRAERLAHFDARDRIAAISTAEGFSIPESKILNDEQIESLLRDLGGDQIEVRGNPDFCNRVEDVARKNGLNVEHEFQIVGQIEVDNFDNDDSPQHRTGGPQP